MAAAPARIEARIRQICGLGLGGEAVMPALLQELHALIPSYSNSFFFTDPSCELTNIYDECPQSAAVGPLYIEEFYNRREREVHPSFSETMRRHRGVLRDDQVLTVNRRTFYRSDLYNLVFRVLGYHSFLRLIVRDGDRPYGALMLWRRPEDPAFTREDERRLARLEPFVLHALSAAAPADVPLVDSGERGVIVADETGRLIHVSPQGRRLLYLATHRQMAPGKIQQESGQLPSALARLCRTLAVVHPAKPPPVVRLRNAWGGFSFHADALETSASGPALIGIIVHREEPMPMRLMRGMRHAHLSRRQSEICLLLANGLSFVSA